MRLCNADVDEAERNPSQFEDFDEPEDDEGSSKSFFDLRQRTLSGMDLMPAFRVVVLGLARKLKNNTKDSILYSEVEDALGRYFRVLDSDMQRFANLHEILRDAADKAGAAGTSLVGSPPAVLAIHNAGIGLLHEGMREIAVDAFGWSARKLARKRNVNGSHDAVLQLLNDHVKERRPLYLRKRAKGLVKAAPVQARLPRSSSPKLRGWRMSAQSDDEEPDNGSEEESNDQPDLSEVLLACGEMQRQCLDLKLDAQRSIASASSAPHISYSKYADFLDEAMALCDQLRRKHEELQQQRIRAMAKLTEAKLAAVDGVVSPTSPAS